MNSPRIFFLIYFTAIFLSIATRSADGKSYILDTRARFSDDVQTLFSSAYKGSPKCPNEVNIIGRPDPMRKTKNYDWVAAMDMSDIIEDGITCSATGDDTFWTAWGSKLRMDGFLQSLGFPKAG